MKKIFFVMVFLCSVLFLCYSQNVPDYILYKDAKIYIEQMDYKFIIIDNRMILKEVIPPGDHDEVEEYTIEWEERGKFSYINFEYNGKLLGNKVSHGRKRYLILYNKDYVTLYDNENNLIYRASYIKYTFLSDFEVKASSELKENDIVYDANNLLEDNILMPWSESSTGNGIGESIIYKPNWNIIFDNITFVFSNGFIDYNRNHLYEYNNRLKKVRIYNDGYNEYYDFDFADSPNYQTIYIEFKNKIKQLRIEVLEVYLGERYNDLCINLFLPFSF
jgi:hypothetical protein